MSTSDLGDDMTLTRRSQASGALQALVYRKLSFVAKGLSMSNPSSGRLILKALSTVSFGLSSGILVLVAYVQCHFLLGLDTSLDCWCLICKGGGFTRDIYAFQPICNAVCFKN